MKKKHLLVLSDGKPGHFNQSLGVAEKVPGVEVEYLELNFKNRGGDILNRFIGILHRFLNLPGKFLKQVLRLSLKKEDFKKLSNTEPNLIISTGSSMAAPNLFWGKIIGAKKITCGIPSLIGSQPFDLVFAPGNKKPPKKENILVTMGTPHRLEQEKIEEEVVLWKDRDGLKGKIKDPCLGLVLGGPVRNLVMKRGLIEKMLREIEHFLKENDGEIIAATSRRTPEEVETLLQKEMGDSPRCRLLILATQEKKNPVPMMAGICDLLLVTEDSATMISELASSHQRVLVVGLEREKPNRSIASDALLGPLLAAKGYLDYFPGASLKKEDELSKFLYEAWNKENNRPRLAEAKRCAREIEKRFVEEGRGATPQ